MDTFSNEDALTLARKEQPELNTRVGGHLTFYGRI